MNVVKANRNMHTSTKLGFTGSFKIEYKNKQNCLPVLTCCSIQHSLNRVVDYYVCPSSC